MAEGVPGMLVAVRARARAAALVALERVKAGKLQIIVGLLMVCAAALLVWYVTLPGGPTGAGADVRRTANAGISDVLHADENAVSEALGEDACALWESRGLDPRSLYRAFLGRSSVRLVDVEVLGAYARATVSVEHVDVPEAWIEWSEELRAYPSSDEERAALAEMDQDGKEAVALRLFERAVASRDVPTVSEEFSLDLEQRDGAWEIVTPNWQHTLVLGASDLSQIVRSTMPIGQ